MNIYGMKKNKCYSMYKWMILSMFDYFGGIDIDG